MITSNQNASLKIDIGNFHIFCFDILACCKSNIAYFNWLRKILNYFNILRIVMKYLLNHDILYLTEIQKKFLL